MSRSVAFYFIAHHTVLHFFQNEGKTVRKQKDYNSIAILALLWWSGTEPRISPRYACRAEKGSQIRRGKMVDPFESGNEKLGRVK